MFRILFVVVALWLAIVDLGAREDWITLENCRLVPNPANDGDNFHASVNGKEYIFRLYFVDAPETDGQGVRARQVVGAVHCSYS